MYARYTHWQRNKLRIPAKFSSRYLKKFEGSKKFTTFFFAAINLEPLQGWREKWFLVRFTRHFHNRSSKGTTNELRFSLKYNITLIYFISSHLTSPHLTSPHLTSLHFTSFHFTSLHFTSFHFISFHFISFHFISFHWKQSSNIPRYLCRILQRQSLVDWLLFHWRHPRGRCPRRLTSGPKWDFSSPR